MNLSNRTRIIETEDGMFMPQFKPGLFYNWRYFNSRADVEDCMLVVWLEEKNPVKAAKFSNKEEAKKFLDNFNNRVKIYWEKYWQERSQSLYAVKIKRVVK